MQIPRRVFADHYKKVYNTDADANSPWTFDTVMIYAQAINAAGTTEPESLRKSILAIRALAPAPAPGIAVPSRGRRQTPQ
jgi:ABC-type branched-subunit amino acid transport system substrate-binding protein